MIRRFSLLTTMAALAFGSAPALAQQSYDPELQQKSTRLDGHAELRPLVGAVVPLQALTAQTLLLTGIDGYIPLTAPLAFEIGAWAATGTDFSAYNFHLGAKYRFLDFHSVAIPYFIGGVHFTWGVPGGSATKKITTTGMGFHAGLGMDFAVLNRVRPGFQAMFDFGPKMLPNVGVMATTQITFGLTFVL